MLRDVSFADDFSCSLLGQVGGLASASAVFQSRLDTELHERLPPGSEEVCWTFILRDIVQRLIFFPQAYQKNPPFSTFSRQPAD